MMLPATTPYLWVRLTTLTPTGFTATVRRCVESGQKLTFSYFGFHTVTVTASNPGAKAAFAALDVVAADGIAVLWTSWMFGPRLTAQNRLNGDILAPFLFAAAAQEGWKVFLLGGSPGVAAAAAAKLQAAVPRLSIAGVRQGYFNTGPENDAVVEAINGSGASIVLVGMAQPQQEQWIVANAPVISVSALIGVGGYFDHILRRVDCYPTWVYAARLNWLYRLIIEPRRLWKRYTLEPFLFAGHLLRAQSARILHRLSLFRRTP